MPEKHEPVYAGGQSGNINIYYKLPTSDAEKSNESLVKYDKIPPEKMIPTLSRLPILSGSSISCLDWKLEPT